MNLHLATQYAILAFLAVEWMLRGPALAPVDAAPQPGPVSAAQEWSIEGNRILVTNLVGRVTVGYTTGKKIVVRAQLQGKDADKLRFHVDEGGDAEFHVLFPLDRHRQYVYPELGRGSHTRIGRWEPKSRSSGIRDLLRVLTGRDVEIRGRPWGDALEAWAEIEVLLPQGKPGEVKLGAGRIEAAKVRSALRLDTHTGPVSAREVTGDLSIDTGSGRVNVQTVRGDLNVDTGSGSIDVQDVEGRDVLLDTGSGGVDARDVKADQLKIDTGSGSVDASRLQARSLVIDTGSGRVRASEVRADDAEIDTGSGSVTLDLVGMGSGRFLIDTGSGGVTLRVPKAASARISASTGSGGIRVELPEAQVFRMSRRSVSLQVGDGRAEVEIDTGSGGIRIEQRS